MHNNENDTRIANMVLHLVEFFFQSQLEYFAIAKNVNKTFFQFKVELHTLIYYTVI